MDKQVEIKCESDAADRRHHIAQDLTPEYLQADLSIPHREMKHPFWMAFQFALNTPADSRIYTLDLPRDVTVEPRLGSSLADREITKAYIASEGRNQPYFFENTDVAGKITLLSGDSATFDYSEFHGKVDFFFIDGAHSYEYARSDTINALKCCHPGSVIAWHDFGRVGVGVDGVSRWVAELSKQYEIYSEPRSTVAYMRVPQLRAEIEALVVSPFGRAKSRHTER